MDRFRNKLFTTRAVKEELPPELICLIIKLTQDLYKETQVDYLQIFKIRNNILIHKQEIPEYRKGYKLPISVKICKLLFVDSGEYSILMVKQAAQP